MTSATPIELQLLFVAVCIGLAQLLWALVAGLLGGRGLGWVLGARDEPRPVSGAAARLERAFANFCETFPLFAAALLGALLLGKAGLLTALGCKLYVAGRAAYPIAYLTGLPAARTLVWAVSFAGIALVAAAFAGAVATTPM